MHAADELAPTPDVVKLAGHAKQLPADPIEYDPTPQGAQNDEFRSANVPGPHGVHDDALALENDPALHTKHVDEFTTSLYEPGGHGAHTRVLLVPDCVDANRPVGHVTTPPCTGTHAEVVLDPAASVVRPTPHEVQFTAPGTTDTVPTGHSPHVTEPRPFAKRPTGHALHAVTFTASAKFPRGHSRHARAVPLDAKNRPGPHDST